MKILLDLQTLQSESRDRGIGRYSRGFSDALLENATLDWEFLFNMKMVPDLKARGHQEQARPGARHYFDSLTPTKGIEPSNRVRAQASQVIRDAYICARPFDLVHVASPFDGFADETIVSWPARNGLALTATVYDFIPFEFADVYLTDPTMSSWYRARLAGLSAVHMALAISEHTRAKTIEFLNLKPEQVVNVGADVDRIFRPQVMTDGERRQLLNKYGIAQKYVIHTGIIEPRKNIESLIAAFATLPLEVREDHQIVLVGAATAEQRSKVSRLCKNVGIDPGQVVLPGFVGDPDLARLYSSAVAAIMPSLAEGFGLPLLEAMRCGCPVLGSNCSSIPEVVGHRELLFDPKSESGIAERLHRMLADPGYREFAVDHARLQQGKFSWRGSAEKAIEAFKEAVARQARQASPPKRPTFDYSVDLGSGEDGALKAGENAIRELDMNRSRTRITSGGSAEAEVHVLTTRVIDSSLSDRLQYPTILLCTDPGGEVAAPTSATSQYQLFGWRALALGRNPGLAIQPLEDLCHGEIIGLLRSSKPGGDGPWELRTSRGAEWIRVESLRPAIELASQGSQLALLANMLPELKRQLQATDLPLDEYLNVATALANNHPPGYTRRLFVDVTELATKGDAGSGIQRVVRNIVRELVHEGEQFRIEPVFRDRGRYRYARQFMGRFLGEPLQLSDSFVHFQPEDIFLGLDLDLCLSADAASELACHHRRGLRVYFVVYDVLPIKRPEWFVDGLSGLFVECLGLTRTFADGFLCISEATAMALREQLGRLDNSPEARLPEIQTFRLGSDLENDAAREAMEVANDSDGPVSGSPAFLSVATLEPRKGHSQLLDAFELLWSEGMDASLTLVGRRGWRIEHLVRRLESHPELGKRLRWLEGISDANLVETYKRSVAVIAASEGEGFGLPIVEAARHAKPVIVRDISVFREVAGGSAFYFVGSDGRDLAEAIKEWLTLHKAGGAPDSKGVRVITWAESAASILRLIGDPIPKFAQ